MSHTLNIANGYSTSCALLGGLCGGKKAYWVRFAASGGVIKNAVKELESTPLAKRRHQEPCALVCASFVGAHRGFKRALKAAFRSWRL